MRGEIQPMQVEVMGCNGDFSFLDILSFSVFNFTMRGLNGGTRVRLRE